jgi:hypothetical protein
MKAALYTLHYIHSTHDYGISFSSEDIAPMYTFIHFPPSTNVEAYKDAVPPKPDNSSTLSAYSDTCWGSQIGSAVADGTLLPLFKFRSMNGSIIFCNGGPVGWTGKCQERTSLSSCEAKIQATNATSKKLSTFVIFVEEFLILETFSPTYPNQLFYTIIQQQLCLCQMVIKYDF